MNEVCMTFHTFSGAAQTTAFHCSSSRRSKTGARGNRGMHVDVLFLLEAVVRIAHAVQCGVVR
jgi:hypothetical protein